MSKSRGGPSNVQNVGKVSKGSVVTRGGAKLDGPVNQRVSPAGHAPSPVKMPGSKGQDAAPLVRSGPISRGKS